MSGVRVNGFQTPFSRDQFTSWVLQPLMMASFITFVAKLLDRDKCIAILVPNGVLILIVLINWYLCESRDPSVKKSSKKSCSLLRVPSKPTRYCTLCCKPSPGLDHHCTWLNTCIADNNYEAFYALVVAATLQTVLQAVIGILMATIWFEGIKDDLTPTWHTPVFVLLWIHNAISLSLANSYMLLSGFHTYLLIVGMGTYDFIVANGSDGLCARMLKCNCLKRKKGKRKGVAREKRHSKTKTTPVIPSCKVVAAPSKSNRGDGPSASDLAASAAKQREVAEWKAEWIRKYGSDDADEATNETTGAANHNQQQPVDETQAMPSGRRGTNPEVSQRAHDQVQIEMSNGINESEGIFEDIESAVGERDEQLTASRSNLPLGARTDL